ncbi:Zinc finger domain-containing protein [Giardia duodenalis]|uniref:Zinc finger domain-containing protein n=1 Tax=Giardia intestinalis (strain ATCC 50803 / WB clone C6) TaxID=184922 RepID=A8B1R0_GIAIC|nr:Zinc finger domain [Giardia intestinalis]KAE8302861.1 Zinc finger domain-containing protein [Giardia intestinalis]|eukprot:XP_001709831.1 Zinc finger domain [Giardia lamblia ATCC 50803]
MFLSRCPSVFFNQKRICRYLGFSDDSFAVAVPIDEQPEPIYQLSPAINIDSTSIRFAPPNGLTFQFTTLSQVIISVLFGVTRLDTGMPLDYSLIAPGQVFSSNSGQPQTFVSLSTQGILRSNIGLIVVNVVGQTSEAQVNGHFFLLNLTRKAPDNDQIDIIGSRVRIGDTFFDLKHIYRTSETPGDATSTTAASNINAPCVICMGKRCSSILLPCRHMCLCRSCALEFRRKATQCPLCRAEVSSLIDISDISSELPLSTAATGGSTAQVGAVSNQAVL